MHSCFRGAEPGPGPRELHGQQPQRQLPRQAQGSAPGLSSGLGSGLSSGLRAVARCWLRGSGCFAEAELSALPPGKPRPAATSTSGCFGERWVLKFWALEALSYVRWSLGSPQNPAGCLGSDPPISSGLQSSKAPCTLSPAPASGTGTFPSLSQPCPARVRPCSPVPTPTPRPPQAQWGARGPGFFVGLCWSPSHSPGTYGCGRVSPSWGTQPGHSGSSGSAGRSW